jgi:NADH:ubiquinone oxidoreductase subunit F (NADH-binding)
MPVEAEPILSLSEPVGSLREYLAAGGGEGLARARRDTAESVLDELRAAGLRGRGGAGFPTADKWASVREAKGPTRYAVCNAAEGEPGTFKDRFLLRRNPYQVVEGLLIAAHVVGAEQVYLVLKRTYDRELAAVRRAIDELACAGFCTPDTIHIVLGPDEYLLGEEKAMIEVIDGGQPLPRIFPPYQIGPFARRDSHNPAVVNNVETLAHVPSILRCGAAWFRGANTTVFTVCGDVRSEGVYELPLGTPLRVLLELVAGGAENGRRIKVVIPGASAGVLGEDDLDTPLHFEPMRESGSGLGSCGFVVYDDSACIVAAVLTFSRFLAIESCAQCPACKHGAQTITECLEKIERGEGMEDDLDAVLAKCATVTGGRRCGLPLGEAAVVGSAIEQFRGEFDAHLGKPCPLPRDLPVPKIVDFEGGKFVYDERYRLKQPDWTYSTETAGSA